MDTSPQRILLVDDECDIRTVASLSLKSLGGFTVESVSSGDEAIAKVNHFKPELILMDVMMPGKDGPTTMQELRGIESYEKVPVIFMTARVQKTEILEYLNLGAAGVISKPFDPILLSEKIRQIWSDTL